MTVQKERLVTLSDGTCMNDILYVIYTDAPVLVLKELEMLSCKAYENGAEDEVPIWKDVIEGKGYKFECFYMSVVEFRGDTETDYATTLRLRISFLGQIALIISNVSFENKRHGTMSKVLEFFIQKCKENNVPKIIIQCVLSEEMASFCLKHGFVPNTNTCIMKNGTILKEYLSGDYELFLE